MTSRYRPSWATLGSHCSLKPQMSDLFDDAEGSDDQEYERFSPYPGLGHVLDDSKPAESPAADSAHGHDIVVDTRVGKRIDCALPTTLTPRQAWDEKIAPSPPVNAGVTPKLEKQQLERQRTQSVQSSAKPFKSSKASLNGETTATSTLKSSSKSQSLSNISTRRDQSSLHTKRPQSVSLVTAISPASRIKSSNLVAVTRELTIPSTKGKGPALSSVYSKRASISTPSLSLTRPTKTTSSPGLGTPSRVARPITAAQNTARSTSSLSPTTSEPKPSPKPKAPETTFRNPTSTPRSPLQQNLHKSFSSVPSLRISVSPASSNRSMSPKYRTRDHSPLESISPPRSLGWLNAGRSQFRSKSGDDKTRSSERSFGFASETLASAAKKKSPSLGSLKDEKSRWN
ncbi:hypothetical protein BC829DRAFT_448162 [Chytridium lagenaria]|nr:hypothetical protein BC829DRAFT_448162 [Chytridium lagenaria]